MPTTFEIHPAIGIARVGNSTDPKGFFIGPEPGLTPPDKHRDDAGNLKRQAARFRVYRCERDKAGKLLDAIELTPADARIKWTVHLVNRKGASPRFAVAGGANTNPAVRRNNATGDDKKDKALIIDSGEQFVDADTSQASFDQGTYRGTPVRLGEIQLEKKTGRLLVLGGFGDSKSVDGAEIQGFSENDSWCDDVSDGPVTAEVVLTKSKSKKPAVKPAWVIVAPPDFAPGIMNLVTLYDTLYDLAVTRGLAAKGVIPAPPTKPSYPQHVLPILQRVLRYQWVNRFARQAHGPGGPGDFTSLDWTGIENPATGHDLRMDIFGLLRDPSGTTPSTLPKAMPRLFSDDYPARTTLPLTRVQYAILHEWAVNDNFDSGAGNVPKELDPDALTRVALEACVGGAFWPGIEAGRILRDTSRYLPDEPFRLSPDKLLPGELTGSMALPWQADFLDCAWEGRTKRDLGWWPAQRPDDVFLKATATAPVDWIFNVVTPPPPSPVREWRPEDMVKNWHRLGIVVNVGTDANPQFVQTERDKKLDPSNP